MKSKVHPTYKTKYRVANWPAYNQALVRRGDVTVWVSSDAIAAWTPRRSGRRGTLREGLSERAHPNYLGMLGMYQTSPPAGEFVVQFGRPTGDRLQDSMNMAIGGLAIAVEMMQMAIGLRLHLSRGLLVVPLPRQRRQLRLGEEHAFRGDLLRQRC